MEEVGTGWRDRGQEGRNSMREGIKRWVSLYSVGRKTAAKIALITFTFFVFQVSYDYWNYMTIYSKAQEKALHDLEGRFQNFSITLEHLVTLTAERIGQHHQNPQQIQHILASCH